MILEKINKPNDIKQLSPIEYNQLADEIRRFLIEKISKTGGHLASNLGVVELTMALHLAFNLPQDKLIWDVGHQSYTHKILTGRKNQFDQLRKFGGMSGFPKRNESHFDAFDTGHSSTSISAGLGLVKARDLKNEHYSVVSVIGDGALTGGMAYEALNNASSLKTNFIIVLNDNTMSIAKNVGGVPHMLSNIRSSDSYYDLKENVTNTLYKLPGGDHIVERIKKTKSNLKQIILPGQMFECMGISYLGPVNGHDIEKLIKVFHVAKRINGAVIIHVVTHKGHGYKPAERNPAKFHGIGPFDIVTGKELKSSDKPTYSDVFSEKICQLAKRISQLLQLLQQCLMEQDLINSPSGFLTDFLMLELQKSMLSHFRLEWQQVALNLYLLCILHFYKELMTRYFMMCAYSIFMWYLQLTGQGLVGSDGETHQGIFDLSFLTSIPNMTVMAPKNGSEFSAMLEFALLNFNSPIAIRYPRGQAYDGLEEHNAPIRYGKAEMIIEESDIALVAAGNMLITAQAVREKLKEKGYNITIVNERFIKPVDTDMLDRLSESHRLIVTMEENVLSGGFGEAVCQYYDDTCNDIDVLNIALPDDYVEHGNVDILRRESGVDRDSIIAEGA